ncbi:MAG: glycosyltransferase, partial [Candidatus Dadabacteria bacterium]|nr:glycosyltransferase [Candidatus Dadabacteria bacterium]
KELETRLSNYWQADVTLFLCPMREYGNRTPLGKMTSFGKGIFSIFEQQGYYEVSGKRQVSSLNECLGRNPSAVFAHRLSAMCPVLLSRGSLPPVFFDFDDIEHIVLSRYIARQTKIRSKLLKLLLPALVSGEKKAVGLATEAYVCSEKDKLLLESEFGARNVAVIPNSVSMPQYIPPSPDPVLLFLGSDYGANLEAADYMARQMWPLVREAAPSARLIIAGISAGMLDHDIRDAPGVEVPGFVESLGDLYAASRAIVTPILVGGGTRFKIIEAAAYGRPVVSTTVGMEGIDLTPGSEILVSDGPREFASACVELLSDAALCERIGLAAREKAAVRYDRRAVIENIRQRITS